MISGVLQSRRLRLGAAIGGALVVVLLLSGWLLYPRVGAWAIRDKALPRLEARFDRQISAGAIEVGRGRAVLRDLVVRGPADEGAEPLARIDRVIVEYDYWASLRGAVEVDRVTVEGLSVSLRKGDDGDNFGDVLDGLRRRGDGDGASSGGGGMRPDELVVSGARIAIDDRTAGVQLTIGDLGAVARRGEAVKVLIREASADAVIGPTLGVDRVLVTTDLADPIGSAVADVQGGRVELWPGMSLTGIEGTVQGTEELGRLEIDLGGGYGGAPGRLWSARGWLDPMKQSGSLDLVAERFTFDRIAPVLEGSMVVDYHDTTVDAEVHVALDPREALIDGRFALSGANVAHRMLAEEPVRDLDVEGTMRATYDRRARLLTLAESALRSRGVDFQITGTVAMPGGFDDGVRREARRLAAHVVIPPVDCQTMLDAIPRELARYLEGMKVRGTFTTDVTVAIDWADLDATELGGSIAIRKCRVAAHPRLADARKLNEPRYVHHVEDGEGGYRPLVLGLENPDYVPLWDLSAYLTRSLMTTEDSTFERHKGFIVPEFRTALIRNLEAGYFRYGASSITMQLVKNIWLYREKTLSRKLQELVLTWYIEQELEKDRILELYVNAIEYGPGIYGIGPASWEYFGKPARYLNPREAAFFSSTLPNPKERYKQYCRDRLVPWIARKIDRIIDLMHKRERLDDYEWQLAKETPLVFDRSNVESEWKCIKRAEKFQENSSKAPRDDTEDG